jgi:hypothetical protein
MAEQVTTQGQGTQTPEPTWEPDERAKAWLDEKLRGQGKELAKANAALKKHQDDLAAAVKKAEDDKLIADGQTKDLLAKREAELAAAKAEAAQIRADADRRIRISEAVASGVADKAAARGLELEWAETPEEGRAEFSAWLSQQRETRAALFGSVAAPAPGAPPVAAPAHKVGRGSVDERLRSPDSKVRAEARRELLSRAQ